MTMIQQVLLELESDYHGRPYHVSGHALYRALARRVDAATRSSVAVSHGVFVPGEHGGYPDEHSQSGGAPYFGAGLRPVESYEDLFLFRDAAQRWLSASRPRDAQNTHDLRVHGGRIAFSPTVRFGLPQASRNSKRTMTWFVQFYLHDAGGSADSVPLDEDVLDGLRVGGARNYGLGETSLKDTQTVDLDTLDYSTLKDAERSFELELVSPYVTASEYPGADDQSVPWWWTPRPGGLRRRDERLVEDGDVYELETIDHGQVVGYGGPNPVETAKSGVLRVGTHSRYGFGEVRLRPVSEDRVPERARIAATREAGGGER
ncbi:hypothetical protein [Halocalculus aciditolerans]|uniref:Uncharacterized protein n=1 Tax=Halocalculus aciditolerans TaxID=1383812 RepID=A0A830FDM6_9EURY|nr:hypothetical protein [Halocalculus aciditolerans]GGL64392.1 hypothetical protein GCM10009039_22840 [Halocalculus aciditolerans]